MNATAASVDGRADVEDGRFRWVGWVLPVAGALMLLVLVLGVALFLLARLQHSAQRVSAANTVTQLRQALDTYYTEYRKLPLPVGSPRNDVQLTSGPDLMNVLLAVGAPAHSHPLNPRQMVFYSGSIIPAGDPLEGGVFITPSGDATLYDPWGNPYQVMLDGDGDGDTEDPSAPGRLTGKRVIVWSAGPDGNPRTWADNLFSW